jgi:tetratricopeptide (TPR) repeat protein
MSEKLKEIYEKGKELFDRGNYEDAEGLLREVIRQNPRYADVLNKLGVITSLKGNLKEAAELFEKALRINPSYTEASMNLIITYGDLGKPDKAQEVVNLVTERATHRSGTLDPFIAGKLANEHFRLGNLYLEFSLLDEAIEEFRKALKLRSNLADVRTRLGVALRDKGLYDESVKELQYAKNANILYGPAWVQLGLTYYMKGDKESAFAEWELALEQNPNLKEAQSFLNILRNRD